MIETLVIIFFSVLILMGFIGFLNMMRDEHTRRTWELHVPLDDQESNEEPPRVRTKTFGEQMRDMQ